ncbi:hypothetical protein V6N11_037429 [Hibiscus sabdariffa]|uniref:Uncharacterized protein n=1 Tax=Hibiscus sabdariffa TaxID=183260 RepID=A0ABR2P1H3_9ROSI
MLALPSPVETPGMKLEAAPGQKQSELLKPRGIVHALFSSEKSIYLNVQMQLNAQAPQSKQIHILAVSVKRCIKSRK